MKLFYDFSIKSFSIIANLFKGASPKLEKLVEGRKDVFQEIAKFRESHTNVVWFHVASLGEYLQARPVIAKLKAEVPEINVVLTFFSPSGYENTIKKQQPNIDLICYLPFDTPVNAKKFVKVLSPQMVFFVKYDIWPNFIFEVTKRQIPLFLFSAAFREDQIYFKNYGGIFKKALKSFTHVFTQNQQSISLLKSIGYSAATFTGDTRFDHVHEQSQNPKRFSQIEKWIGGNPVVIVGSAWQEDMNLILPFINSKSDYKFIIAPHDIDLDKIRDWQSQLLVTCELYSNIDHGNESSVLFIDNIGMLSSLYQYGKIAYVGGAFGKGLHNILEPLAYQIPVMFGKLQKVSKFPEAAISQNYGCGFEVKDADEFNMTIFKLQQEITYNEACAAAKKMVEDNLGSAKKIIDQVMKEIR